jgi:Pyridine nucleotide-disulphide oxidoreductase
LTSQVDIDFQVVATAWLLEFARSVNERDVDGLRALLRSDASWRDLLAVTGQMRTSDGLGEILALLENAWSGPLDRELTMGRVTRADFARRYGVDVIEAFFDFTTQAGRGTGIVRLKADDPSGPSGWMLLTTLRSLDKLTSARPANHPDAIRTGPVRTWPERRREEVEYAHRDPAVVVIGAGQNGLAAAAHLKSHSIDTLILEGSARVGDSWRNRYDSLRLHNDTRANHLPFLPFPSTWEVYTPKDQLAAWFEFYAEALALNVWTGTQFTGATWLPEEERWLIRADRAGTERELRPRHIVIATGVSGIPNLPTITGLDGFAGPVVHSSAFRDASSFAGKRVLVVGTGNSGHDMAQDLDRHGAAEITMMQHSPTTVISLEPGCVEGYSLYTTGLPTDEADLIGSSSTYPVAKQWLPVFYRRIAELDKELLDGLHAAGFETDLGEDDLGFPYKHWRRGGGYYIDIGCSQLIIDGRVKIIQARDLDTFTASGVTMTDGSTLDFDAVVLATGYQGLQEGVRRQFGDEVADRVGPVWGLDREGELRNIGRRTPQRGLWFLAGGFPEARIYSHYLGLLIAADENDVPL